MELTRTIVDDVLEEMADEVIRNRDPLMALAGCVGIVMLHWETLDGDDRSRIVERLSTTVRNLERRL